MSQSAILNEHFKVIEFSDGAIYGPRGATSVLTDKDAYVVAHKGCDIVFEYTGPNDQFTLENLVFYRNTTKANAPADVAIWVSKEKPVTSEYSSKFDNATIATMNTITPNPTVFHTFSDRHENILTFNNTTGKYIHIKYITTQKNKPILHMPAVKIIGLTEPVTSSDSTEGGAATTPAAAEPSNPFAALLSLNTSTTVAPEVMTKLVKLGVATPIYVPNRLNPLILERVYAENDKIIVILFINDDVEAISANPSHNLYNVIQGLHLAANYKGYGACEYYYVDAKTSKSQVKDIASTINTAYDESTQFIDLPSGNTYDILVSVPNMCAFYSQQREGYIAESLKLIRNQIAIALRYRGLAKKGAQAKQKFLTAVESAINDVPLSQLFTELQLTNNGEVDKKVIESLSCEYFVFSQLVLLHQQTQNTEISPYSPVQKPIPNNHLPGYPRVEVVTANTYQNSIINCDEHVLVVYTHENIENAGLTKFALLIDQFLHHCGYSNIKVVLLNPVLNHCEEISEENDRWGAVRLFAKNCKYSDVEGSTVLVKAFGTATKPVTCIEFPVLSANNLFKLLSDELDGKTPSEEDEYDVEEDTTDETTPMTHYCTLSPVTVLTKFLTKYKIVSDEKPMDACLNLAKLYDDVLTYLLTPLDTDRYLTRLGIGPQLKYKYAANSTNGKSVRLLASAPVQIAKIIENISEPLGTAKVSEAEATVPHDGLMRHVEELAALSNDINDAINVLRVSENHFITAKNTYLICEEVVNDFDKSIFGSDYDKFVELYEKYKKIFGPIEKYTNSIERKEVLDKLKLPAETQYEVDLTGEVYDLSVEFLNIYGKHKKAMLEYAKSEYKKSGFSNYTVFVTNMSDLESIFSGQMPKSAITKSMLPKGSTLLPINPELTSAMVYISDKLLGYPEQQKLIMEKVKKYNELSETNGLPPHCVVLHISFHHFEQPKELHQTFMFEKLPAVELVLGMDVISDVSLEDVVVDELNSAFTAVDNIFEQIYDAEGAGNDMEDEDMWEDAFDDDTGFTFDAGSFGNW